MTSVISLPTTDDVLYVSNSDESMDDFANWETINSSSQPSSIHMTYFATTIDPPIKLMGSPHDLNNFLPDSSASQHMTPRLSNLYDMEEGLIIGIQVADGHIIMHFCWQNMN